MADTFTISSSVLNWIKNTIDMTSLPVRQQDQLFEWCDGKSHPTFKEMTEFSKKAHIPLGYLFLSTPPEEDLSLVEFRTVDSTGFTQPSRDFMDTYYSMKSVQDWMIEYLEENEVEDLEFTGLFHENPSVTALVNYLRRILKLDPEQTIKATKAETFNTLRNKISDLGVLVMQNGVVGANNKRALNLDEFRGFALFDKKAPLIFINARDSVAGKVFTLIHEFVHILIGTSDLYNSTDGSVKKEERLANAVTAELLVPSDLFRQQWQTEFRGNEEECVTKLAANLANSKTVIARKALDQGLINQQIYHKISTSVTNSFRKKEKRSGGDFYKTVNSRLDKNFLISLGQSVETGNTTYMDAFRLTNTSSKTFRNVIESAAHGMVS